MDAERGLLGEGEECADGEEDNVASTREEAIDASYLGAATKNRHREHYSFACLWAEIK